MGRGSVCWERVLQVGAGKAELVRVEKRRVQEKTI